MAAHRIEVAQPPKTVLNTDITFTIYSDNKMIGELSISKGGLDWRPSRRRKAVTVTWEKFAGLLNEAGDFR